ncbi:protein UXT homolog [Montipora capricornis]|uniref:protein UXT homolog n=1 Tax=Montipora foliosa TaxID=591990 RepID=UPI0035F1BEBC
MADGFDLEEKVKKYEEFVNDKLRKDLEMVRKNQEEINAKISEYLQLKSFIENVKSSEVSRCGKELKTQVDLGCNFYCQARITDPSKVLVSVGYGFYVEFTLDEALVFIEKKCNQLTTYSSKLGHDSARIKANIKLVMEGLRELQDLAPVKKSPISVW